MVLDVRHTPFIAIYMKCFVSWMRSPLRVAPFGDAELILTSIRLRKLPITSDPHTMKVKSRYNSPCHVHPSQIDLREGVFQQKKKKEGELNRSRTFMQHTTAALY